MTLSQEELLAKLQDALVRKAEVLLRCLRRASDDGVIETLEAVMPQLKSTLDVKEFPPTRRKEIGETAKGLMRAAYKRGVEVVLFKAEHSSRDGDTKGRNENLTKAKDYFVKAMRYGADDDFRVTVEKRVQHCLMTSARGVDEKTKAAAAVRLEARDRAGGAPEGGERRRALRYSIPPLNVDIDGTSMGTANWSQLGLLVDGYTGKPPLKVGDRVRLELGCAGITVDGKQVARVVRVVPGKRQIALEFPEISTIVLDLIQSMKRIGFTPRAR